MLNVKKTIVIVGGAGFLGRTFIQACKNEKMTVFVMDILDNKAWETLNLDCDLFIQTDINNSRSLINSIKQIDDQTDKIDCVINTSYPQNNNFGGAVFNMTLQDFNENVDLHLGGYFHIMQKFAELFIEQGHGNIINITSIQGVRAPKFSHYKGTDMMSPIEYTAAKSAIISISKYMAKYLIGKNIRINCISPGGILDKQPEVFLKRYKESCINKGMLDADDLVGTLLFLISDHSKYINGQNIIVDDGWSL